MISDRFRRHVPCLAALTICCIGGALYLVVYGWGAVAEPDTVGYRSFHPHRTLGYPLLLAAVHGLGLLPVLGAIQLAAMFFAALFAWEKIRKWAHPFHWVVLLAIIGNVELIKHCFREMPDALFAAAVLWHVTLVVDAIVNRAASRAGMVWIIISASAMLLLRPAGLALVVATAIALFANFGIRKTAWAMAGVLVLAAVLPSLGNWAVRGYFYTHKFADAAMSLPALSTITALDETKLTVDETRLYRSLVPLAHTINDARWPFERAIAMASVSNYAYYSAFPEVVSGRGLNDTDTPRSADITRNLTRKAIKNAPFEVLKNYSANVLATLAAPGFIDRPTRTRILGYAGRYAPRQSKFYQVTYISLGQMRVIDDRLLVLMRVAGLSLLLVLVVSSLGLVWPIIRRLTGTGDMISTDPTAYLALNVIAYLFLISIVVIQPRYVLSISPVIALFLGFVGHRVYGKIKGRRAS